MLKRSLFFVFAVVFLTRCAVSDKSSMGVSSTSANRVSANAAIARPVDEAKIEGSIPEYEIEGVGLDYLQALPLPPMYFDFNSEEKSRVDLPDDARAILEEHWNAALKFFMTNISTKRLTAKSTTIGTLLGSDTAIPQITNCNLYSLKLREENDISLKPRLQNYMHF